MTSGFTRCASAIMLGRAAVSSAVSSCGFSSSPKDPHIIATGCVSGRYGGVGEGRGGLTVTAVGEACFAACDAVGGLGDVAAHC